MLPGTAAGCPESCPPSAALLELLAVTGMRISEAIALQRLPVPLVAKLRGHLAAQPNQDSTALAFPSEVGGPLAPGNLRRRVLKPLPEEVGAPWAGFHTFRHTFASSTSAKAPTSSS
jgi:integrase